MPLQPDSKWDADMVAWPAHAEANARLQEEAHQTWTEDWAEYRKASDLLAANEAAREAESRGELRADGSGRRRQDGKPR